MSSLLRRVLAMIFLILVVSFVFKLFISLFPLFLIVFVFLFIYSFLFGSRSYYVYRSCNQSRREDVAQQFSTTNPNGAKKVDVQVKDIK